MDLKPYQHCLCQRMASGQPALCDGPQAFTEQGKKVKLTPRRGENVYAVALDGCVFTDNKLKCDGLFLFCGRSQNVAVLVELKGTDIQQAFKQLAYVRYKRSEYQSLREQFKIHCQGQVVEKAFIISSAIPSLPDKEKLEEHYGIRVKALLHSDATAKVHDLRDHF